MDWGENDKGRVFGFCIDILRNLIARAIGVYPSMLNLERLIRIIKRVLILFSYNFLSAIDNSCCPSFSLGIVLSLHGRVA